MIQRAKSTPEDGPTPKQKQACRFEGTPPDGDMEHGFVIGSWTPLAAPLDTPEQIALFRRTVNTESEMFFMVASRSPREMALKHLEWRVGQIRGDLNLALYKFGMLDCALCAKDPKFSLRWIAEALPILEKSKVMEPFASYFYMRAGSFVTLHGRWDLCSKYVRKGIKLLPEDASKVLWAPELHRLLSVFYMQQGKFKSARSCIMKVQQMLDQREDYPQALLLRVVQTVEALCREAGDVESIMSMEDLRRRIEKGNHPDLLCQNRAELLMEYNVLK